MDARPLAHPPGLRGLIGPLLLIWALRLPFGAGATGAATPVGLVPDLPVGAYLDAARRGATGSVSGRVYEDRARLEQPEAPLASVELTLVPRSDALLARLAALRREVRDDPRRYPSSAEAIVRARREYEQALVTAGGSDLLRRAVSGPDGTFLVPEVPAGPWLLLAERTVYVERPGPAQGRREAKVFQKRPRLLGYDAVTLWVQDLTVRPGQVVSVELNDRNAWMTGIREKRAGGDGLPPPEAR